ncbi:YigZ family protein [Paramylibacter ulvae]|nr:YigZ family protein [Amylibacter ulvae]
MLQIENVVSDKGSKYAVSGGAVASRDDALVFIKTLKRKKKYAKATHNTWAMIQSDGTQIKNDDGESGAGAIILRMLERDGVFDHIIVVTRWYGGTHLGGDRFRHVQTCVRACLDALK